MSSTDVTMASVLVGVVGGGCTPMWTKTWSIVLGPMPDSAPALSWPSVRITNVTPSVCAALGALGDADTRLAALAGAIGTFRDLPRGPLRIAVLALAAATAGARALATGDRGDIGTALLTELEAHSARAVLVGWPVVYLGSKRRFEGLAALAAGDAALAVERLEIACDENRDAGPALDRTRAELGLARARR